MNNIKFYRTKACKTASETARAIGVSRQIYCFFENEHLHRFVPADKVEKLCKFLNCDRVTLLNDEIFRVPIEKEEDKAALIKKLFSQIKDEDIKQSVRDYVEENEED